MKTKLPTLLVFSLCFASFAILSPLATAQESNGKGPVFTAAPDSEPSYPLMGEFAGEIKLGDAEPQTVAIQIRPLGKNAFQAIQFAGGLPGQENWQGEPVELIGRRSEGFVVLSGGPYVLIVEKNGCTVIDRKGDRIGKLSRVTRHSPTLGAPAPKDAIVLFDGTSTDQFTAAQMTKEGLLQQGATIKPMLHDFNLHVEFMLPYMPEADGQSRGNSGIYLQSRYECQILDSFGTLPVFNGLGALYRFRTPDLNMCLPPLVWQTYDIQFTAARWAADQTKIRGAHVTSWVNGVKVQDNIEVPSQTGSGKVEEPTLLPTLIQDHGDPVRFRNVWVVDRGLTNGEFPIIPTKEELAAIKAKKEAAKAAVEKAAAAKKAAAKKAAAKKAAAKKAAADKAAAKKAAADKAAAEKAAAEKAAAEKAAAEKAAAEKAAAEKAAADKAAAEKAAAEAKGPEQPKAAE
ncbi:Histone H1-like nucleoprotein HC2 [Planctomycetes bacterium CA13]|uniref:Histone H1-like nucleoprotein HC2 n=1 Tax=Novipirellula herctigrandis TaxID=2527986 RepID=A0A5C5Z271_9BACT|nr:Histone H1-like nucleoprotein HC2 [Planctomycetes bacterium CA13]